MKIRLIIVFFALAVPFVGIRLPLAHADITPLGWNQSTLTSTSSTFVSAAYASWQPAFQASYTPQGQGKAIVAYINHVRDSCGSGCSQDFVNVMASSDAANWGTPTTLTCPPIGPQQSCDGPDLTSDPNSGKIFLAYYDQFIVDASHVNRTIFVTTSTDGGVSWTNPARVASYKWEFGSPSNRVGPSPPSIAYDYLANRLIVVTDILGYEIFESTDSGNTFSDLGMIKYGGSVISYYVIAGTTQSYLISPDVEFLSGRFFMAYIQMNGSASGQYIQLVWTTTDLINWTGQASLTSDNTEYPVISFNPVEGLYHITYRGTTCPLNGNCNPIYDITSSDAITWGNRVQLPEYSSEAPGVAFFSKKNVLLMVQIGLADWKLYSVQQNQPLPPQAIFIPPSQTQQTGTATATDVQDSYVDQANPTANYGTYGGLYALNQVSCHACGNGADLQHAYLQFSLPSLPQGAQISQVTLNVYQIIAWVGGSINLQFWAASSSWSESGANGIAAITWNNAPGGVTGSNVVFNGITDCKNCTKSFDLTNIVKSWYNGQYSNNGIWVEETVSGNPTFYWSFYSKEGSSTNPPSLTITYTYYIQAPPVIPATMCAGQQASVTITMKNTGSSIWNSPASDASNPYRLGVENPSVNGNWSPNRVDLSGTVSPGGQYSFSFTTTAPSSPGNYNFLWQMVQDGVAWFGDVTPNDPVVVNTCTLNTSANPSSIPADGTSTSTITVQTPDNQANLQVNLSTNLGSLSASSCITGSSGACSVTISSSSVGNAVITSTASGWSTTTTSVSFTVPPSFTISTGPTTQTANIGSTASFGVGLTGTNGFSGTVNLAASAPSGVSCSVTPPSVSLAPSPANANLSCSSSTAGEYSVSVKGTSGSLTRSTSVFLIVGLSLYFRDNFTYASTSQMTTTGWAITGSHVSVGGGVFTLQNDGQTGAIATWANIPSGNGNWTVATRAEWVSGTASYYGTLHMDVYTTNHWYIWGGDGYYSNYVLYRDGGVVYRAGSYNPQIGVWHTLRIDMRHGLLSLYFDGALITTFTESDPATGLIKIGVDAGWESTDNFNFIEASGFSFHDDFSYSSITQMTAAGWSVTTPTGYSGYASVSGGLLTLVNDGSRGASATWTSVPLGVSDWTISAGEEWVGGSYGTLQLNTWTARHSYVWHGDGYYNQYIFYRDGQIISRINGYAPQMNAWHTLRMDMRGGVLSLYFDGSLIATYTETDPSTSLTQFGPAEGWMSTVSFDFTQAARIDTSRFDFGLSTSPTSISFNSGASASSTVSFSGLTGSTSTASLVALVSTSGLTVSFNPVIVSIPPTGSASSTITFSSSTRGTYYVTLTVSDGIQFHSTTLIVTVS